MAPPATVTAVAGGIKQDFEVTVKQPEVASLISDFVRKREFDMLRKMRRSDVMVPP